jgi:hypothetical protein
MVIKVVLSVTWLIGDIVIFISIDGMVWQLVGIVVWSFIVWQMYLDVRR